MRKKAMSIMVVISVIVFSASLCSAGWFSKKGKKKIKAEFSKCVSERNSKVLKCEKYDLFEEFDDYNNCVDNVLKKYDACSNIEKFEAMIKDKEKQKKAAKQLKKIEKAEDKCGKNWFKSILKCGKGKTKEKRMSCKGKADAKREKCDAKVKKMRDKL